MVCIYAKFLFCVCCVVVSCPSSSQFLYCGIFMGLCLMLLRVGVSVCLIVVCIYVKFLFCVCCVVVSCPSSCLVFYCGICVGLCFRLLLCDMVCLSA